MMAATGSFFRWVEALVQTVNAIVAKEIYKNGNMLLLFETHQSE